MMYWLLLIFSLTGWTLNNVQCEISSSTKPIWNATWTDILKRDLLTTYDRFARPSQEFNQTIVNLSITIIHLDIDEVKSTMSLDGWVVMKWNDDKLKWNPSDYGGLAIMHLAPHEVWRPDILVYNSASGSNINYYGETNCILYNNGDVLWVPPSRLETYCNLNLKFWPFDSHICMIKFGSWTHHAHLIDLAISTNNTSDSELLIIENHEWKINEVNAKRNVKYYACCTEPYPNVEYNITIERRSTIFKTVVITPAIIIILMTLANFWLPPQSGEKIFLNGINAIIIVLQLLYFSQKLPSMALQIPLIVCFYSVSLYLVAFSTIISIIVINFSRTKQACGLSSKIKKLLDGNVGKILGIKRYNVQIQQQNSADGVQKQSSDVEVTPDDDHQSNTPKNICQNDWILFATAIDRIFFVVYCIVFALLAIIYSI